MIAILLILFATLFTCAGQLCQKQAASTAPYIHRHKIVLWLVLGVSLLGCGMLVWLRVLQTTPVNVAYPMLSLNFVWITLAAKLLWKEPISLRHWVGVTLIIIGATTLSGAY